MKIIYTSDIHNHPSFTNTGMVKKLAADIRAESPDLTIIGGDIGENAALIGQVLGIIDPGALLLGNHDLWSQLGGPSSLELWDTVLPNLCESEGWHYLENKNWIKDGVAVVGSYLHYDYSAADPEGVVVAHIRANHPNWTADEYYERMKKKVVNDAKYFTGLPRDKDFADQIGAAFVKRLLDAEFNSDVHTIVVATHVPCMPSQITRDPQSWHWSCATAYFGILTHVDAIMSCTKVKYVLSGHSHQGNQNTVKFHDGHEAEVINLGADYGKPIFETITV